MSDDYSRIRIDADLREKIDKTLLEFARILEIIVKHDLLLSSTDFNILRGLHTSWIAMIHDDIFDQFPYTSLTQTLEEQSESDTLWNWERLFNQIDRARKAQDD